MSGDLDTHGKSLSKSDSGHLGRELTRPAGDMWTKCWTKK